MFEVMEIELKQETWYEITLSMGKVYTAYYKNDEFIFTDGSSKFRNDIVPFSRTILPCSSPENVLHIVDFLPDIEDKELD
jgi:hypothetical protein